MDMLQAILLTVITAATPLVIAASGELVAERSVCSISALRA